MGVRLPEQEWKRELNSLIRRHQDEIHAILRDAGVPLVDDYGKELIQ
jgi:16S rRNA C1402 (ribose-2'-O) methylase RsmI